MGSATPSPQWLQKIILFGTFFDALSEGYGTVLHLFENKAERQMGHVSLLIGQYGPFRTYSPFRTSRRF